MDGTRTQECSISIIAMLDLVKILFENARDGTKRIIIPKDMNFSS
jgi:hypothetical protein